MSTESILRLEVPSQELLDRLTTEPLPLGLRGGKATRGFQRDIYLDTPDGELQARGVTCRFRIRMDDRRTLTVTIREAVGAAASLIDWQRFESDVAEIDPVEALQGMSEPARRLRAVLDPQRLGVRVELEIERSVRVVRTGGLPLRIFEIAYDRVGVRSGSLVRQFQEIRVRRLRRGRPDLDELAQALQTQYGLKAVLASQFERAEELLSAMGSEAPSGTVTTVPEVSLIALYSRHIAMRFAGAALRLPFREGSGADACRQLGVGWLSDGGAAPRLLGTVAAAPASPALEVWLSRGSGGDPEGMNSDGLVWVSVEEALSLAGAPVLRDPKTLAALSLMARSEPLHELFAEGTGADVVPTPTPVFSRESLRDPTLSPDELDPKNSTPAQFLNGEMSWLEFNQRLIELAEDSAVPLLARIQFLSIFSSNIDEFFMVRVGALRRAIAAGTTDRGHDGMAPHDQLDAIAVRLRYLLARQRRCLEHSCLPALAKHGIRILRWSELSAEQRAYLERHFEEQLFPLLTPHAITRAPGHPFPHISNLSLSLAVMVRDEDTGRLRFGTITLPPRVPRFVRLPESSHFVPLEEVIRENLADMYPGRRVEAAHCFRVTRSGDLELDEEHADDLLQAVEEEAKRRPFAGVVRLEMERSMPRELCDLLQRELRMVSAGRSSTPGAGGIYEVEGLLDLSALGEIASIDLAELQFPEYAGKWTVGDDQSIFDVMRERDLLVHHPYDTFEHSTQRLFEAAASDPDVEAVKLTLYRAGGRSPVVEALIKAAKAGKQVDVFVELKARFDEQRNIEWVRKLEAAGVHVVYGLVQLKTHAKTALIVRREDGAVRRYVHVGTGNYNAATARLYTDLGLLSCDPDLGADLSDLFNELTGSSQAPQTSFRRILVAPSAMMKRFRALIEREIQHAKEGRGGRIRVKVNGLADRRMVRALYRASQAGVEVDLVVRSICTLRPGVAGLSDRIRVVSHIGRFLEHARIYHFGNGGDDEYYIGSADWRPRNLRRRVEIVAPVLEESARARLDRILETELSDPGAWDLTADGAYVRRSLAEGTEGRSAQEQFMAWST